MNRFVPILFLAACTSAIFAQTPAAKPATPKAASPAAAARPAATPALAPQTMPWIKLPPGVPRVAHLPVKMPFALRFEDIVVGKGAEGESGKLWHLKYTGWRAADGIKFDSWDDHKQPVVGSDGKPELGPDGKPKMADPSPMAIPIGVGRVIPGFDYGLDGMKIGGKRRIFIPWQMAYGTRAMPDRPDHPGIPAKSDLIFDVELVDVTDVPQPPHPQMPGNRPMPPGVPHPGAGAQPNAAPTAPTSKPALPATPAAPATPSTQPAAPAATTPSASAPAQPATPAQTTPPQPPSGVQAQPK
jgi:peptidylprolyl isomerase